MMGSEEVATSQANLIRHERTDPADDESARLAAAPPLATCANGGATLTGVYCADYGRLSWIVLALLPVFALGLRALDWRKDAFYFAHLVFSLHYHTFLLMFWTAYVAMGIVAVHFPSLGCPNSR